ncbi:hypothetical protein COEREDRAFT_90169 [Coemansia reversa NRRL 1564]|uniref:Probable DNA polymerase n=1 Tax=Coemansia reversa (strain ATCC 12441 / NRRL 1564) TaxID=763665 RepID=A0A2G5B0N0_COERN|nr:hypothetical protein COEREDRAFT_90169 [Coemansia reversa NRRL 1564]|eukprot:PIA12569.1 hypothetical protein COEREDRAFT_90169 [Coemansia reversa NRRL 1564]
MDPKDIYNFDFRTVDNDSDAESVASDDGNDDSFMLEDWRTGTNTFDTFEFRYYTLSEDLAEKYENGAAFVNTIFKALSKYEYVTSIRLLADIQDLDNGEDTRWNQTIRFELTNFVNKLEMRRMVMEYLSTSTAPVWHRLLTDETSDRGYNKSVKYHRNYFDFCIQKPNKGGKQVTTICGEREIHPGIFVKMVTDHGIAYRKNDCLIRCLNEVFDKREDPDAIRKEIWGEDDYFKDLHRTKHINYIARRYNTKLMLSDLVSQDTLIFNKSCGDNVVQLVKVGKVLGILDRVDHTVDKRNSNKNLAYFDLETVGPDQRVYAFTWRHKDGDLTICHNNLDEVEHQLTEKILDTIEGIGDGETVTAYSWNGSRFDSWIVFKLLKKKYNKRLWVHDIIANSANELLTFKLTINDGGENIRHMVFKDAKKMFSVSIPEACKVFAGGGVELKKHEFDHDEVDKAYMEGGFDDFIKENRGKILDYVRQDGVLLEVLTKEIAKLYAREDINMYTVLTRSVASSIAWQKTIEHHKILKDVTLSPYAEICNTKYNDIMDHAIGGRTQCVRRGTFENVCGIDVNSMYPYVCANREYPCGDIVELGGTPSPHHPPTCSGQSPTAAGGIPKERVPKDKLGVYLVRIKKQSYPHVIPYRRSKHYAYNWQFTDKPFEKWITSVDMEQLDDTPLEERTENFVSQNYDIIKGFYWTDKTDKFYKDFMIDNYSERTSIEKSDPRNMHIKLKMNGVTGSVFQHSFRELIMIFTKEEFEENVKKYSELVTVIGCEAINDRQYIVTMRPVKFREGDPRIKAQKEFCKGAITQKPWVLTMFTYSYARKILRDEWIKLEERGCKCGKAALPDQRSECICEGRCKVIYCDTDSLFFQNNGSVNREEYIHVKSTCTDCTASLLSTSGGSSEKKCSRGEKELGKWSIECWNDEGSFYTPKVYAIKNIGKLRIKGVGFNSLVIDTEYKNADLNYDQKLKLYLDAAQNPHCDLHNDIDCASCPKRGGVHPSYKHVRDLVEGKPLKTINFIMEKSSQHGIQKKYEIKIIK